MQQLALVTAPNNNQGSGNAYSSIAATLNSSFGDGVKLHKFDLPIKQLTVGTLDSLIALSDDLRKINNTTENVVRKIERQFNEIVASVNSSGEALTPEYTLRVNEVSVEAYLKDFKWDFSKFQVQGKQLSELVGHMQGVAVRAEDELKQLGTTYADKIVALSSVQRKKQINLLSSDFEDFLVEEDIMRLDMQDTEHLLTVMVVVPKAFEAEFLASYDKTMGADIGCYGGVRDWSNEAKDVGSSQALSKAAREAVRGSVVVPDSKRKVCEEGDSSMWAITMLKGHYEAGSFDEDGIFTNGTFVDYLPALKVAFREKKCTIRDFSFSTEMTGGIDQQIEKARADLDKVRGQCGRWCKAHFGEVFAASMHVKMVRAFVESVLRYGLPVDFTVFFLEISTADRSREKEVNKTLTSAIFKACPELSSKRLLVGDEDEDEDGDETVGDNLPYVFHPFHVLGLAK